MLILSFKRLVFGRSESIVSGKMHKSSEVEEKSLDFDKILKFEIGEYGPYQILVATSIGFVTAFGSFLILNFLFISAIPEHR